MKNIRNIAVAILLLVATLALSSCSILSLGASGAGQNQGYMTEDEVKLSDKAVQDLTDKYIKNVDTVISKKETEVLSM